MDADLSKKHYVLYVKPGEMPAFRAICERNGLVVDDTCSVRADLGRALIVQRYEDSLVAARGEGKQDLSWMG